MRNMRSIGIDPGQWSERGLLHLLAERPSRFGLEAHLAAMYRAIDELSPETVVVDSITDLLSLGGQAEVQAMLTRLIDYLKTRGTTVLFSSLSPGSSEFSGIACGSVIAHGCVDPRQAGTGLWRAPPENFGAQGTRYRSLKPRAG